MARIKSLTREQQARFAEFRDRWLAIGLATEPAQRERAEEAIRTIYAAAGLPAPQRIVWCGSPLSQGLTRAIILDKRVGDSVWDSVRDSVRASVWASVRASVRASVWDSVGDSVGDSAYGQHDAAWLGFYEYFREVVGLTSQTERLSGLIEQAKAAGWFLPHRNICWVSERHNVLARDERGRLHNVSGPAVAYPDGWAIYAVHGVRVPERVVMQPQSLTPKEIEAEKDTEVRRVMMERFGYERYILESGAQLVHSDEFGTLYRKDFTSGGEPLLMVHVVNGAVEPDGTRHKFMLGVHPELRPILRAADEEGGPLYGEPQEPTAKAAVASTYGLRAEEYDLAIRT